MWFVLVYTAVVLLLHRVRCGRDGGSLRIARDSALVGLYVTATDLFLDPLGTSAAAWTWIDGGAYFGTPLANYAGWFFVATVIGWVFLSTAPRKARGESGNDPGVQGRRLDWTFGVASLGLTALCLSACVIRLNSVVPVFLSSVVMAPFWVAWFSSMGSSNERA
jgi:uncharacterized membrane protein